MIILGAINLAMLLFSFVFFIPKDTKKIDLIIIIKKHLPFLLIIFGVVALHLFEVNLIDQPITEWMGHDFANNIKSLEGDAVYWFSQHWTPVLVYFFVIMYIVVYPFTLWFSPAYFLITDNKKAMKTLAYGLLLIYIVALPFYLFLPITNVYTYYNIGSALESVIPSIENFFYTTTTQNNCLPSLHTAITILIAYSASLTKNKKFTYFAYFTMISVIISVIYLSIHWITDVITGGLLAVGVIFILRKFMREE
jgi:membrane-associated phospholipid phosphatase